MDTPTIAEYYRETKPMKRLELLEKSIAENEDPEGNAIRKELWDIRYSKASNAEPGSRADGFLGLWMNMEFNKNNAGKLFGAGRAARGIRREMERLRIPEFLNGSEVQKELIYREICHMIRTYMHLCKTDRSYNTAFAGLIHIKEENSRLKLKNDIFETAVELPKQLKMEEELAVVTRAAAEVFEEYFPGEGGLPTERRK
ncbi:MAG: hypothetical protein IJX90_10385 [Blautia sp.]|nr:hypothetical protein [Blautia sp.]